MQSLLTFSPRRNTEHGRVELNTLVENVLRLLHHRIKQLPPDTIKLDLAQGLPAVNGNPAELEQVILNLILNALDAVDEQTGEIFLKTHGKDSDRVVLEVIDNGCGIEASNLPKIFDPFYTTKALGQGVGIGLSTCYHIIQAHGGEISVDSAPQNGAAFKVTLPQI